MTKKIHVEGKLALLCTLLLLACDFQEENSFFKMSKSEQIETASKMPTNKVYSLYVDSFNQPPPPLPHLQEVLGTRGQDALWLWANGLSGNDRLENSWEYGPLLSSVKVKTGKTLCSDQKLINLAVNNLYAVTDSDKKSVEKQLRNYC